MHDVYNSMSVCGRRDLLTIGVVCGRMYVCASELFVFTWGVVWVSFYNQPLHNNVCCICHDHSPCSTD